MNSVYGNENIVVKAEYIHSRECFLQNAFLFFDNAESILGDPRMSMARVPVSNGLAYLGAIPTASLGAYLDWWQNSGTEEVLHDKEGRKALTWYVSGSPLTGINTCSCVYPDGTIATICHGRFALIRKTFSEAIKRHRVEEQSSATFSIEEVAEILKTNATTEEDILRARLTVQQSANSRLRFNLNQTFVRYQGVSDRYENICLKYHKDELSAFRRELLRQTSETGKKLQVINEEICMSRKAFREGNKSKEEHDVFIREINQRRSELKRQLAQLKDDRISRLTANGELTIEFIESYLQNK